MNNMRIKNIPRQPDPSAPSRHEAYLRYRQNEDLLDIAKSYSIPSRTLLAWINHELSKWINDPQEGRDPGPGVDYSESWPDLETEMEWYAKAKLLPDRFLDQEFRASYINFLAKMALR